MQHVRGSGSRGWHTGSTLTGLSRAARQQSLTTLSELSNTASPANTLEACLLSVGTDCILESRSGHLLKDAALYPESAAARNSKYPYCRRLPARPRGYRFVSGSSQIIWMVHVSRQLYRRQLGRTAESTADSLHGTTEADPDIGDTKSQNVQHSQCAHLGLQQLKLFATTASSFPGHPNKG